MKTQSFRVGDTVSPASGQDAFVIGQGTIQKPITQASRFKVLVVVLAAETATSMYGILDDL